MSNSDQPKILEFVWWFCHQDCIISL